MFLFPHLLYISVSYNPKLWWPKNKIPFCLFSGLSYEETYCTKALKAWDLLIVIYIFSLSFYVLIIFGICLHFCLACLLAIKQCHL